MSAALASSSYVRASRSTFLVVRPRKLAFCPWCHLSAPHCSALRSCAMIHSIAAPLAACTSVARGCCVFEIPGQISTARGHTEHAPPLGVAHRSTHLYFHLYLAPSNEILLLRGARESVEKTRSNVFLFFKKISRDDTKTFVTETHRRLTAYTLCRNSTPACIGFSKIDANEILTVCADVRPNTREIEVLFFT